jgi:hypothetical protein
VNEKFCTNCGAEYRPNAAACANCGHVRVVPVSAAVAPGATVSPLLGCLLAIPGSLLIFLIWFFAIASALVAPSGSCAATNMLTAIAVGVCVVTLVFGVWLAIRKHVGLALLIMLSTFAGIVPATMCTVGIAMCSSPSH